MFRVLRIIPLLLVIVASSARAAEPRTKETHRYSVYLLNARVGSVVSRTFDHRFESRPAIRAEADSDIRLKALGSEVEQKVRMQYVSDLQGHPLTSRFVMTSAGRTTTVVSTYFPDRIVNEIDPGGRKSSKTIPIPKGVTLREDPQLSAGSGTNLMVGGKSVSHYFDPSNLTIQRIETEVLRKDQRRIAGKSSPAYLIKCQNSVSGASESWVDPEGRLLEDNSTLGLRLIRDDVEPLPGTPVVGAPGTDFAVATAVKTTTRIAEPRKTTSLRVKLMGLPDEGVILSDYRQLVESRERVVKDGEPSFTATYHVRSQRLPPSALPLAKTFGNDPYLTNAAFLDLEDPAIRRQAEKLARGAADRLDLAKRIRSWIKGHMEKPSNIGTPRAAEEIMRSREGVCRDYATLFGALARASGLPTRLCTGMLYMNDGFYYHAWVECRLTDEPDGWVAFDATLDSDFVDATHLKFAHGDPTEMLAGIRVIGRIQAEILESH